MKKIDQVTSLCVSVYSSHLWDVASINGKTSARVDSGLFGKGDRKDIEGSLSQRKALGGERRKIMESLGRMEMVKPGIPSVFI